MVKDAHQRPQAISRTSAACAQELEASGIYIIDLFVGFSTSQQRWGDLDFVGFQMVNEVNTVLFTSE